MYALCTGLCVPAGGRPLEAGSGLPHRRYLTAADGWPVRGDHPLLLLIVVGSADVCAVSVSDY